MTLRALCPVGWDITAFCHRCGHASRCWADGESWYCRGCFNDVHGFDPKVCEWGAK